MTMHEASRTLVKSSPELWAECSDGESLTRHLGAFGEIRITKLEPETAVAWEGDEVRGTVTLEPSGWGTRVVLTATVEESTADPQSPAAGLAETPPEPDSQPEPGAEARAESPVAVAEPEVAEPEMAGPEPAVSAEPEPAAVPEPEPAAVPEPEPVAVADPGPVAVDEPEPIEQLESAPESAPSPEAESSPEPKRPGFFARLFGRKRTPEPDTAPLGDEDPLIGLAGGGTPSPEQAEAAEPVTPPEPEPGSQPEPAPTAVPELTGTPTLIDERPMPAATPESAPVPDRQPDSGSAPDAAAGDSKPTEVLVGALDSLGTPHKRPFSRD